MRPRVTTADYYAGGKLCVCRSRRAIVAPTAPPLRPRSRLVKSIGCVPHRSRAWCQCFKSRGVTHDLHILVTRLAPPSSTPEFRFSPLQRRRKLFAAILPDRSGASSSPRSSASNPDFGNTDRVLHRGQRRSGRNVAVDAYRSRGGKSQAPGQRGAVIKGEPVLLMSPTTSPLWRRSLPGDPYSRRSASHDQIHSDGLVPLVAQRASREPPDKGGWNIFYILWSRPVAGPAGIFPCVATATRRAVRLAHQSKIEALRDTWFDTRGLARRKRSAKTSEPTRSRSRFHSSPSASGSIDGVPATISASILAKGARHSTHWNLRKERPETVATGTSRRGPGNQRPTSAAHVTGRLAPTKNRRPAAAPLAASKASFQWWSCGLAGPGIWM